MATSQQIQANRANARRSTGPRTAAGKAKSSLNALKHGLRAQATVLPGENISDFHTLVDELENQFQPATALEWTLLRQLADAEWRMRRVPHIEAGVLTKKLHESREHYETHPDQLPADPGLEETFLIGAMAASDAAGADVFSKLSRYEARLSHRYFKALEHLRQAQDRRHRLSPPTNEAGARSKTSQSNPISGPSQAAASAAHQTPFAPADPPTAHSEITHSETIPSETTQSEITKCGQSNPIPTTVLPDARGS
jgi:hypothetical protein